MKLYKKIFIVLLFFGTFQNSYSNERFVIDDIILKGLQRVDSGSIYSSLPFEVGDSFDTSMTPSVIKSLFKSKFFNDIIIERIGNSLVITFDERPTIVDIDFEGFEGIEDEQLNKILDAANIAPGRIYDSSVLERIKSELREQSFARGMYSVDIKIEETMLRDNRIYLNVLVNEGVRAQIKHIKIVGNKKYSDARLKKEFQTATPKWYMFWSDSGVYSSPMLGADLERLSSFYQDMGFMDFEVESTQVTLSKSKKEVYITINIVEGEQYVINKIKVAGKLIVPINEIVDAIEITTGEYISRANIIKSADNIRARLSEEGFAFSKVNPIPKKIEGQKGEVDISFYIDPGNRTYVRRINIAGNISTQDEVYRREIRQMEGGWYSSNAIKISKSRLKRLNYVEGVDIEEVRVPGSLNQLDLNVKIKEKLAGSFNVGAGLGGSGTGFSLSAGVEQDNFLGSGNKVSFNLNTAKTSQTYAFDFFNPYHNLDSVSRSFGFNIQTTKTDNTDTVSDYEADMMSFRYSYGLPMTENNRFNLSLKYVNWNIGATTNSSDEVIEFINLNGKDFDNFSFLLNYSIDTRDSSQMTRSGFKTKLSTEVFVPGSDLEYYKLYFQTDSYFLVNQQKDVILRLKGIAKYGQGYGGTKGLPFYDRFKAGGPKSVRGYEKNSLSPYDSEGQPLGGDFMVAGTAEVIFTPPIEVANLKTAFFTDFGRAYKDYDSFEFGDLKGSIGLSIKWLSPFGGISVSISTPLNSEEGDKTEAFQFNLGTF
tara:strand:+ start:13 stop:2304 length:2292 start_codon:yes stop_codon:yes gene_type:complete